MQYLSTKDYAELVGLSESTIRKKCQQNKLPHVVEKYNNRDVYRVKVEDTFLSNNRSSDTLIDQAPKNQSDKLADESIEVSDAEIVSDTTHYPMITIEKDSFDSIINNFTKLSEDFKGALDVSYNRLESEYLEIKAELKAVKAELQEEKLKAAQFEADNKIKDLRIQELEKKTKWFRKDLF